MEEWALTIRDLKFLLLNAQHIYGDASQSGEQNSNAVVNTEGSQAN